MSTIVAFVLNDARTDSRVLREAATLAAAGHELTLIARTTDPYAEGPEREASAGFAIVRVPVASGPLRWVLLARRPGALARAIVELVARRPRSAVVAALPAIVALPILAVALAATAAGALAVRLVPALRILWLGVSWRLQWRFGVEPWARAAAAAAAAAAPHASLLYAHDLRALPAAIGARGLIGPAAIVYDSHEIFTEAGQHALRPAWARRALATLERRLARQAAALVTVNAALAAYLGPRLGLARVEVVHNCPPRWSPTRASPLRAAAGVPEDAPLLLYHGGIAPGRGIEVLAAVIDEPGLETAHLVFLGFGPSRGQVEALVRSRAAGGRIHLLDPVAPDDLLDWVAGADVVVAPIQPTTLNHRLSTPNKVFEGIAAGVPVVASDTPAIRAIVVDDPSGPLGAVADPDDPVAFARAVRDLLDQPADERLQLRERCLAAAHRRWNWETESGGLVGLVTDLAGGSSSEPQRVTFVLPGSGEHDARTRRMAVDLAARGHAVTIVARAGAGLPDEEHPGPGIRLVRAAAGSPPAPGAGPAGPGIRPLRTPAGAIGEARRIAGVARRAGHQERAALALDEGADLYHAMGFLALPVADRLARRAGVPFVYDARDIYVESNNVARLPWPARRLFLARERRWARRAARVITVNESCAAHLEGSLGIPRPAVVMNGQRAWVPPDPPPDHLRRLLGLAADRRVVLYHGGFMPDRGLPELMRAIALPGLESAELVLMGSGAIEPAIRRLAADSPAADRIHLVPPVPPDELLGWVASADVGVMPNQPRTLNERLSTPNKLFECLAAGTPVVSSDFPERRRILLAGPEGPLGAVCDPRDPASIAAAIGSILALDPEARAALRARCRAAAETRYGWDAQFLTLLDVYGGVTGRRW